MSCAQVSQSWVILRVQFLVTLSKCGTNRQNTWGSTAGYRRPVVWNATDALIRALFLRRDRFTTCRQETAAQACLAACLRNDPQPETHCRAARHHPSEVPITVQFSAPKGSRLAKKSPSLTHFVGPVQPTLPELGPPSKARLAGGLSRSAGMDSRRLATAKARNMKQRVAQGGKNKLEWFGPASTRQADTFQRTVRVVGMMPTAQQAC